MNYFKTTVNFHTRKTMFDHYHLHFTGQSLTCNWKYSKNCALLQNYSGNPTAAITPSVTSREDDFVW